MSEGYNVTLYNNILQKFLVGVYRFLVISDRQSASMNFEVYDRAKFVSESHNTKVNDIELVRET